MPKCIIVYSALHTGTWFTIKILTEINLKKASYLVSDRWFKETLGETFENLNFKYELSQKSINKILKKQEQKGRFLESYIDYFVIQAHQRYNSNLYNLLTQYKQPEIPIIVPFRDPLLSLNTRISREAQTINNLHNENLQFRKDRAKNQAENIIRIIRLNQNNILFFPIDLDYTQVQKEKAISKLSAYTNIPIEKKDIIEHAKKWEPVNKTKTKDDIFTIIKNDIIDNKYDLVKKYYQPEFEQFKIMLFGYKNKLAKLGYNLKWLEE